MVVTLETSTIGGSNSIPSNPYKYAYICGKKFPILESLKRVTTILILVDIIFLFEMYFFSIPFLIFRCIMTIIGYWCLYMTAFKDSNPRIMIFFIFNQFIDNIYAIFMLILVIFIGSNFGIGFYDDKNDEKFYKSIEIFIIISNIITLWFKTLFVGYYTKLYKFLLWHQEHINSIIATYTNSTISGNNSYPNPPPNILIVPGSREIIQNNQERPPLPTYNDVVTEQLPEKLKPFPDDENIHTKITNEEQSPPLQTHESISNSPIDSIDLVSTPDFHQILLDSPSIFDIIPPTLQSEEENKETNIHQNHLNNETEPPPIYYISTSQNKPKDQKEDINEKEFDDPFH